MPNLILPIEDNYTIFGIRSNLTDFTLCYFLNKKLNLNLSREKEDVSLFYLKKKIFFSLFTFYNEEQNNNWSLIKNETTFQNKDVSNSNLFTNEKIAMLMYLIPEYRRFDFFIKITGLVFDKKEIISLINSIKNIELVSEISIDNLSSRDNLIL